ncbi:MAG: baseplate assembly protein [Desulfosudaceae bacterium]
MDLPEIEFVETDASGVESSVITAYEAIAEKKLRPGDPVRLFLESLAYLIAQQRSLIDYAAKQNLLAYAGGDYLDHLGMLTDTQRLEAKPAKVEMEFEISESRDSAVLIPEGTRVTPGGQLYFATVEAVEISAGDTSVTVTAECTETGTDGNGYVPGQIDRIVDPVSHVTAVRNTDTSLGGTDKESDDNFRERIRLAPEKYSSAGARLGYKYWAMEAHQDILDVSVLSPEPGEVEIYVLMKDGELPDQEVLDDVDEQVNEDRRRPLSDSVNVQAPEQAEYDLDITYYISTEDATRAKSIQSAVEDAVSEYRKWQRERIGRDINPSELIRRVQQAGAKRVEVDAPDYAALDETQVAAEKDVNVTYGGLEDA